MFQRLRTVVSVRSSLLLKKKKNVENFKFQVRRVRNRECLIVQCERLIWVKNSKWRKNKLEKRRRKIHVCLPLDRKAILRDEFKCWLDNSLFSALFDFYDRSLVSDKSFVTHFGIHLKILKFFTKDFGVILQPLRKIHQKCPWTWNVPRFSEPIRDIALIVWKTRAVTMYV